MARKPKMSKKAEYQREWRARRKAEKGGPTKGKLTTEERGERIRLGQYKKQARLRRMSVEDYMAHREAGTVAPVKKRKKRVAKSEAKPASTQDQPSVLAGCPCCPSCGFNMTYMNEAYNLTQAMKRS